MKSESNPCFGIDLGTTCSTIGRIEKGSPRLREHDGSVLLPSVVSYPDASTCLVGRPALNSAHLLPDRTIRSAKRLMGTDHRWSIDERWISPVDVSARILEELCRTEESQSGLRPSRAVISVPAWFTQAQRADTRSAGEQAGLEVVRVVNEPTAAALAHAHGQDRQRRALVYDLGGGTFDVSLVEQDGPLLEVKASHGDTRLGGDDFDQALLRFVQERLEGDDPDLAAAVQDSPAAMVKLTMALEAAKIELSSSLSTTLRVPYLVEIGGQPRHFETELFREDLEERILPLIESSIDLVEQVLRDAAVKASEVDELLLVGGSSRIPLVWRLLRERIGLEGSSAIPPDTAVGLGVVIQAAIVEGSRVDGILVDVAPFALSVTSLIGAKASHMACTVITPKNTPLPARHTEIFATSSPVQSTIRVSVFQGSDPNPLRNTALAQVELHDIPPAPPGQLSRPVEVEFRHDLDGMVAIQVKDRISGLSARGKVVADGLEVAQLRAELLEELATREWIPGDGTDPDPFLLLQDQAGRSSHSSPDETLDAPADLAASSDIDEARETFRTVTGNASQLANEHPKASPALQDLAKRGAAALAEGREAEGVELFDELTDLLFNEGIYL